MLGVVGTRPEAIKMAPVMAALKRAGASCEPTLCVSGQHREMLSGIFHLFDVEPDVMLDVMTHNQTLSKLTSLLFAELDRIVDERQPDWIIAQGDTTTVMVAAMVSFYRRIRFGHVEAGLRTHDRWRPFPEEINRRIADLVADRYYAPTEASAANLLKEGVEHDRVLVTGNTVIDALLHVAKLPYDWSKGPLADLAADAPVVLITAHRRENFGGPFERSMLAIRRLAEEFADHQFVFPVHLNPNVQSAVGAALQGVGNVRLLSPFDYLTMVHAMKRSRLILTDSGGVQEEAPSLRVPVLVLRDSTERPEGVAAGGVKLVGSDPDRILQESRRLLTNPAAHAAMATGVNPYGDGRASQRIVDSLLGRPL